MNESEKMLRLLNQHWSYSCNNDSFASKCTRSYFGRGLILYISEIVNQDIRRYWKSFLNAMRVK